MSARENGALVRYSLKTGFRYPTLFAAMFQSGKWTEEDLAKVSQSNILRVLRAAEQERDRLTGKVPAQVRSFPINESFNLLIMS